MHQFRAGRIVEALLGCVFVVGTVFTLRMVQFSDSAFKGAPPLGPALQNYESRIRATQVLFETGRLDESGN